MSFNVGEDQNLPDIKRQANAQAISFTIPLQKRYLKVIQERVEKIGIN